MVSLGRDRTAQQERGEAQGAGARPPNGFRNPMQCEAFQPRCEVPHSGQPVSRERQIAENAPCCGTGRSLHYLSSVSGGRHWSSQLPQLTLKRPRPTLVRLGTTPAVAGENCVTLLLSPLPLLLLLPLARNVAIVGTWVT